MAKVEENWNVAPTSVKVGFIAGIPALLIGVALIAIAQFFDVPLLPATAIGGAFLGAGVWLVIRLLQGNFPGGIKPDERPDL
jgi:hypothetical protein